MNDPQGQVAIVTGASSGIGEGVARELGAMGMNLVLTARREEKLEALAQRIGAERCRVVAGDIADEALPTKLIDAAVSDFGRLDVVFNNAGTMHVGTIQEMDLEAMSEMVRVNVEAVYRLAYLSVRRMLEQNHGHLFNVSSILGTKVRPTTGAYAGTKYAVEALTEDFRMQVAGTGVRVCAIEPGLIETQLQDHFAQHPRDMLGIKRMVKPTDVATLVRFILEQPAHVTLPRVMVMPSEQGM